MPVVLLKLQCARRSWRDRALIGAAKFKRSILSERRRSGVPQKRRRKVNTEGPPTEEAAQEQSLTMVFSVCERSPAGVPFCFFFSFSLSPVRAAPAIGMNISCSQLRQSST